MYLNEVWFQFVLWHYYYYGVVFSDVLLSIYFYLFYCIPLPSWPHAQNNKVFKVNKVSVWFYRAVYLPQPLLGGRISLRVCLALIKFNAKDSCSLPRPRLKIQKQTSCWNTASAIWNVTPQSGVQRRHNAAPRLLPASCLRLGRRREPGWQRLANLHKKFFPFLRELAGLT